LLVCIVSMYTIVNMYTSDSKYISKIIQLLFYKVYFLWSFENLCDYVWISMSGNLCIRQFFLIVAKQHFFKSKKFFSRCSLAKFFFDSKLVNFFFNRKKTFFEWKESFSLWMRRLLFVYVHYTHGSSDTRIKFL